VVNIPAAAAQILVQHIYCVRGWWDYKIPYVRICVVIFVIFASFLLSSYSVSLTRTATTNLKGLSAFNALTLLVGGRKGIRNWVVGCWRGYLSGARWRFAYAQLMPLPLTQIQIGFTFLVLAHPGSPGDSPGGRKTVVVVLLLVVVSEWVWQNVEVIKHISPISQDSSFS